MLVLAMPAPWKRSVGPGFDSRGVDLFPVGAAVGALFAARARTAGPTKARWFGPRYLAQAPPGTPLVARLIPWMLALTASLSAAVTSEDRAAPIGLALVGLLIAPFFISSSGRHLLFDDEGVEVVSPWRGRRSFRYREITRIRRTFEHEGYIVRTAKGDVIHVPDHLSGGITLAAKLLKHLPEGARVSKAARAKLLACSVIEAE